MSELQRLREGFRWGQRPVRPAGAPPWERRAPREFPTGWARTPAARAAREVVQVAGLRPLVRAEVTPSVSGLDRLRDLGDEPAVLVANHASHLDTAVLLSALPAERRRRLVVVAAADYFFDAWWRAAGTALAFGTVPIERRGGQPSRTPGRLLADGWSLLVFPEGTRTHDGWQGRWRQGAGALALEHGAPLVPVAVRGSYAAMPRGRSWPAPGRPRVHVAVGRPLRAQPGETPASCVARAGAEVARLLDEDATDWWSSLRRAADGATPAVTGPVQGAPAGAPRTPGSGEGDDAPAAGWRRRWEASRPVAARPEPGRRRVWQD